MKQRRARILAWSLWGLLVCLMIPGEALAILSGAAGEGLFFAVLFLVLILPFGTVGALIGAKRPENVIGWIFLGVGLTWAVAGLVEGIMEYVVARELPVTSLVRTLDWIGAWLFVPAIFVPVSFSLLLFPNGRLISKRWAAPAWLSIFAIATITVAAAFTPGKLEDSVLNADNPFSFGSETLWLVVRGVGWPLSLAGMFASVASLVIRFRRSAGEERQQIKWLAYAGLLVALFFLLSTFGFSSGNETLNSIGQILLIFGISLIPIAAGIAILRYRLYDIDFIANKALVYGTLAAFITLVYLLVVIGVGAFVLDTSNVVVSIIATALIALAFQPAKVRAQRMADRIVYGSRVTPYEAMAEFSHRMASMVVLDEILPKTAEIAAKGTSAQRGRARVFLPGREDRTATWPAPAAELANEVVVPVMDRDEHVGEIAVAKPAGETLRAEERRLLEDLAAQAGLALRTVRLIEELRASRQRIVTAQDKERKRMERDIHDGAQQQLVAMSVKLGLAQATLAKDPARANALLEDLRAEATEAVETLRDLARGIFPQVLADKGLVAALQAHINKMGIPATISSEALDSSRLPEEVEAAVYFCIREALQNASKHAPGAGIDIDLRMNGPNSLAFEIKDQGPGFDPVKVNSSSGMQNMADRIEAIGGTIKVVSIPGQGTRIKGTLPIRTLEPGA
jgi:signal transduction histidine kinase